MALLLKEIKMSGFSQSCSFSKNEDSSAIKIDNSKMGAELFLNHKKTEHIYDITPIVRNGMVSHSKREICICTTRATFQVETSQGKLFDPENAKDAANLLNQLFKTLHDQNRAYMYAVNSQKEDYKDLFLPYISNEEFMQRTMPFLKNYLISAG